MNIVTLDFETYFDDEYSLKKMTTEAYIRDPRFEAHGCSLYCGTMRDDGTNPVWLLDGNFIERKYLKECFADLKLDKCTILCHHAQFDGLILSHHYGVKPHAWLDTLSMARLLLGNHLSVSLASLSQHFGLAAKNVPYNLFKGKHWGELPQDVQRQVSDGAIHDVELTWQVFNILAKDFPPEEYRTIDTTIRMFTEPVLEGDVDLLGKVWTDEAKRKDILLAELQIDKSDLQSPDTFARLLGAEGVEPETKDGKNGPIYAFAKTDQFMKELLEHDNPRVAALAAARLGVRSTIDQTRAERLGWMATRGPMPVYLSYCGAHTTRWSGGDKVNWQNFRRGGDIRKAIKAPAGHKLAIVDLSQIECRILNYLAGEQHVLEAFQGGRDLYCEGATRFYGRTITRSDTLERHLGKTLELGCGFGMGAAKFRATCKAGALGGPSITLSEKDSEDAVHSYRGSHPNVVRYWGDAGRILSRLAGGSPLEWGPMTIQDGCIILPNGAPLIYKTLEFDTEWNAWKIKTRNGWTKLYGGKLVENVVQALARVVVSQAMNRITAAGVKIVLCAHDELVACLPDDSDISSTFEFIKEEMKREPVWLPNIPLDCEGVLSERYEK